MSQFKPTADPKDLNWLYDSLNVANKRTVKFGSNGTVRANTYSTQWFYGYLDSIQVASL